MKVELQNIQFFPARGGIESYFYNVSKTLLKLGHEPSVFCAKHIASLPQKENIEDIEINRHKRFNLPLPFRLFNPIYYSTGLQRHINERIDKVDAFWSRHPYYCYATGKVLQRKKPLIYIQAFSFPRFLKINYKKDSLIKKIYIEGIIPQTYLIEKKALSLCDKVVTLSKSEQVEISSFYKMPTNKFLVVPPGVNLERFKPKEKNKVFMNKWNIKEDDYVILTVGRLTAQKNVQMLIKAFSKIRAKKVKLIIVGDGFQRRYLERLVNNLGIKEKTIFTGFRSDVEKFYNLADVFVCSSIYEGFGHVYLEAMASGVPCIGIKSDYPYTIVATEEIIEDGKSGFIVKRDSIEDMALKLDFLINDKKLQMRMSIYARHVCETKYRWESSVGNLLSLTKKIQGQLDE
jgi:glycosyltransferase involved in cell wall biosynthesis